MLKRSIIVAMVMTFTVALATVAIGDTPRADSGAPRAPRGEMRAQAVDPIGNFTVRVHGANRYATAVAISQLDWPDTWLPYTVYLATGSSYADALALGPATFHYPGPLLLVSKDTLPSETAKELKRLQPCEVIAVGGKGVISDSVLKAADKYAAPASDPTCY